MANNLQRLTSTFLSLFLLSPAVLAFDNYKEFKRDRWDFELGSELFYSEANYVNMGSSTQKLTSGSHFQLLDVNLSTRYMPRRDWSLFAMGTISNAESKDSISTRTNSSFSQALLGFDFMMYNDWLQMVPEVAALIPFEKVDKTSDKVLNSEGVYQAWARLNLQKELGAWRFYGWAGFNYRGEGRSYLMPWGFGIQSKWSAWNLGAEIFGAQSITDDSDSSNKIARQTLVNTVDAGSYKFYYPNPSVIDSRVFLNWNVSPKWSLQVNGGTTLAGENTAAGYHVGGFVRYSYDLSQGYSAPGVELDQSSVPRGKSNMYLHPDVDLSSDKKVNKFREETSDGVDQTIFQAKPTQRPKPTQNTVDEELQKQMDAAEIQIELKQDKRKKKKRSQ